MFVPTQVCQGGGSSASEGAREIVFRVKAAVHREGDDLLQAYLPRVKQLYARPRRPRILITLNSWAF